VKLTFAEHLHDFRIEKKMSLRELADLLGVSHTLIGLIETNKRRASSKFIRKFAKYSEKDPKLLEFIANPMPLSYKQSIYESEGAPDFLKDNWVDETADGKDNIDEICLALFQEIETRTAPEDRIYYRRLIKDLEKMVSRPVIQSWAVFYSAVLTNLEIGPEIALRSFQDLYITLTSDSHLQDAVHLRLQACFRMGEMSRDIKLYEQAIQYFLEAKKISDSINNDEGKANSYYLIGDTYRTMQDREQAIQYWQEGVAIEGPHQHLRAKLLGALGSLYKDLGRYAEAIDTLKESARLWKLRAVNDSYNLAATHQEISSIFYLQGDYDTALDYVRRSLIIFTRLEDEAQHSSASLDLAKSRLLKSAIFANNNQLERATSNLVTIIQDYHRLTSIDLNEANQMMREAHELLGLVYEKTSRWNDAEDTYKKIAQYPDANGTNSVSIRIQVFINLHQLYNKRDRKADAISMLLQADALVSESDLSDPTQAPTLIELNLLKGNVAFDQGNTQEGVKYHLEACELSRKTEVSNLIEKVFSSIGNQIQQLYSDGSEVFAQALYNTVISWVREHHLEVSATEVSEHQHLFS